MLDSKVCCPEQGKIVTLVCGGDGEISLGRNIPQLFDCDLLVPFGKSKIRVSYMTFELFGKSIRNQ